MSPTALLNVVEGQGLQEGSGQSRRLSGAPRTEALDWEVSAATNLLVPPPPSRKNTRNEAIGGVAIGQFIKISINSLSISTVTCAYPLCGDKITASLCTKGQ